LSFSTKALEMQALEEAEMSHRSEQKEEKLEVLVFVFRHAALLESLT
jgi:hypothetical protein